MNNFIEIFTNLYPLQMAGDKFIENYYNTENTNTNNALFYILLILYIIVSIYTLYLLYKCIQQQDASGNYVNNISEFVVAVFFLPVYLVYRTFINPCKSYKKPQNAAAPAPTPSQTPTPIFQNARNNN